MEATSIGALEALLQQNWDVQTLSVYADCLQAVGDPRGDLIAMDLVRARDGDTPALLDMRRERLLDWLGADAIAGRPWSPDDFRYGLLEDYVITSDTARVERDYIDALFQSPAGAYLRGVTLFTSADRLAESLELLATRPMRWLRRLAIRQVDRGPVPAHIVAGFVEAAPHVEELALEGARILLSPCHPNLCRLRLTGGQSLVIGAAPMAHITELDLAFGHRRRAELPPLAALINPRAFPALERLDLARNEYTYPTAHERNVGVFPFLGAVEHLERVTHLRLPSLRTEKDVDNVRGILERFPTMEIEIARMYARFMPLLEGVDDTRLRVPAPRPWPPPDEMSSREALTVTLPGDAGGDDLALTSCTDQLEAVFDTMAPGPRAAWMQIWRFLGELGWESDDGDEIELPFPAATLATALDALTDGRSRRVAQAIRAARLSAGADVMIKRYWGW